MRTITSRLRLPLFLLVGCVPIAGCFNLEALYDCTLPADKQMQMCATSNADMGSDGSTQPDMLPETPTGLAALATSPTSVLLTWQSNAPAPKYRLERRLKGVGAFTPLATASVTGFTVTDTSATAFTQYDYRVVAVGANGGESTSSSVSILTPPQVGSTYNIVQRVVAGDNKVYFCWPNAVTQGAPYMTSLDASLSVGDQIILCTWALGPMPESDRLLVLPSGITTGSDDLNLYANTTTDPAGFIRAISGVVNDGWYDLSADTSAKTVSTAGNRGTLYAVLGYNASAKTFFLKKGTGAGTTQLPLAVNGGTPINGSAVVR